MSLLDRLNEYCGKDIVPMHMPGHKRNTDIAGMSRIGSPYGIDITEIDGFDNLHNPTGILQESMQRAAQQYGSRKTWYLVNGSSIGLLAAVLALTDRREAILAARNCHISVYNAIYENELYPVYTYPEFVDNLGISHGISPENVEKLLYVNKVDTVNNSKCKKIGAIVITSPTYEGNISDVESIARIAHDYGVPLIVDEAHGAHFKYSGAFPKSALELGADVVVQSIHKTLPSLTQTALLHVGRRALNSDKYICRIDRYLNILQTTSPSYILMASIDNCLELMNRSTGNVMMEEYVQRLCRLRKCIGQLSIIKLAKTDDISKIVIYTENGDLQGRQLYDILLKQYHIQPEMASYVYVTLMTSVADKQEYYDRLLAALSDIDARLIKSDKTDQFDKSFQFNKTDQSDAVPVHVETARQAVSAVTAFFASGNEIKLNPYDAVNSDCEEVACRHCAGRISAVAVCVYPPGIPLIYPGEMISDPAAELIRQALEQGLEVTGLVQDSEQNERKILCLK